VFNKPLIEEQNDLETVSFTMLGNIERLDEASVRMLNKTHMTGSEKSPISVFRSIHLHKFGIKR
jgi:hypothetical protein